MYRLLISILLIFNLNLLLSVGAKGEPKAVFPELSYNFGKINEGEKASHIFRVISVGDEPLEIKDVIADCGCTATSLSKKNLPPKEEGEIKVTYDSHNRIGNFQKNIRVITNDPEKPKITLKIRGTVKKGPSPCIKVTNQKIDFGVISLMSPHNFAISVQNIGDKNLIVKTIKNYSGEVFLNSEVLIAPDDRKIIQLTYHPKKTGVINESMTIYSNDPARPRYYMFINGYVEKGEKITLVRKNQQYFIILNNTAEKIIVIPRGSMEGKQAIAPYKSATIDLGPNPENNELTISLGFKKEER